MAFKTKVTHTSVPTHLKWIVANPGSVGKIFEIVTILRNAEWRTITFFTSSFKFNMKLQDDKEYHETYVELYKAFKRGYVIANIKDETNLETREYSCSVEIDAAPESKGGRKYELSTNRVTIAPSPPDPE